MKKTLATSLVMVGFASASSNQYSIKSLLQSQGTTLSQTNSQTESKSLFDYFPSFGGILSQEDEGKTVDTTAVNDDDNTGDATGQDDAAKGDDAAGDAGDAGDSGDSGDAGND